ncbi:MAG: efflux RND transporter periplasmic adaptor subunit [Chloroflexi bacterium]|nr:efflux RND transporter periplasmic adaptor subunit [Chloroflexota bacterium]
MHVQAPENRAERAIPPGEPIERTGRHRPPPAAIVLAVLVLVVGAAVVSRLLPEAAGDGPLAASGTFEVDEVPVAAEANGRVVEVLAREGDGIRRDAVLVRLDDALLRLQRQQAPAAQRQLLDLQIDRLAVRAPIEGVVVRRLVQPGAVVAPGAPLLVLADPRELRLTLYVLERNLGRIAVGQPVDLRVDAYPTRRFAGAVRTVATRAEFTPRNVQTAKDRANLVFAVDVRVPNPDGALRPGMPADAVFASQ